MPTKEERLEKPPLGLMPEQLFYRNRAIDICEAIQRYTEINKPIPNKWVKELTEIIANFKLRVD